MALLISSQVYFVSALAELCGLVGSNSLPSATRGAFLGGVEAGESGKLQMVSWTHWGLKVSGLPGPGWPAAISFYCCCMRLVLVVMGLGVWPLLDLPPSWTSPTKQGHRSLLLTFGFPTWSGSSVFHLPSPQNLARASVARADPFLQTRLATNSCFLSDCTPSSLSPDELYLLGGQENTIPHPPTLWSVT